MFQSLTASSATRRSWFLSLVPSSPARGLQLHLGCIACCQLVLPPPGPYPFDCWVRVFVGCVPVSPSFPRVTVQKNQTSTGSHVVLTCYSPPLLLRSVPCRSPWFCPGSALVLPWFPRYSPAFTPVLIKHYKPLPEVSLGSVLSPPMLTATVTENEKYKSVCPPRSSTG